MAGQVRLMNVTAVALLAVSSMVLLVGVFLISLIDGPVTKFNTFVVFARFGALALMCIAAGLASSAVSKSLRASSMSPLMWRHIRETPDDEAAYEQTAAIGMLNRLLFTGRNDIRLSSLMLVVGSVLMAATYALEMFSSMGYLRRRGPGRSPLRPRGSDRPDLGPSDASYIIDLPSAM